MKTIILKLSTVVFPLLGFLLLGCSDKDVQQNDLVPNTVFDSLQGEWRWKSTYDPKKGIIENEFESAIHFLSVNNDSRINYETYKNDTLKKSGKLKIVKTDQGRKIEPDILLHYNAAKESRYDIDEIYFEFLTKDSLRFHYGCCDNPEHFYSK